MSNEANKKKQGDYYRKMILEIETNLMRLKDDRIRYGRFMRFVRGINRNIRNRERQIKHYKKILDKAVKDGRAI